MAEKEAKSKAANGGSAGGGNGPESSEFRSASIRLIRMYKRDSKDFMDCTG